MGWFTLFSDDGDHAATQDTSAVADTIHGNVNSTILMATLYSFGDNHQIHFKDVKILLYLILGLIVVLLVAFAAWWYRRRASKRQRETRIRAVFPSSPV